jgi:2-polyprenyl-3-methyl-5-hydroxy-6-metoxy-1,4-benzoquinol methylase
VFPATGYLVMICEAVRQLTGAEDYTLQQVNIMAACILHDSQPTELVLAMKPVKVTSSLDSPSWYEFTISSQSSSFSTSTPGKSAWTRHCTGQVRAGPSNGVKPEVDHEIVDLPRKVNMTSCYQAVRETGLKYGPAFQRIGGVTAHPAGGKIVRRLKNEILPGVPQRTGEERPWHYHPITLDFCFQLFQLSSMDGLARNCRSMTMPTYLEEAYIRRPTDDARLTVEVTSKVHGVGGVLGDCVGVAGNGELVMRLRGCRMTSLDDNGDNAGVQDPHAAARVVWRPHLDFQSTSDLISTHDAPERPQESLQRLTLLCCVEALDRLGRAPVNSNMPENLVKFQQWLNRCVQLGRRGQWPLVDDAADLVSRPADQRARLLDTLTTKVQEGSAYGVVATALRGVLGAIEGISSGEVSVLDVLRQDDVLTQVYNLSHKWWDFSRFLRLLGHRRPHLRVLEIGAGTGGTTELVLKGLVSEGGDRMFQTYVFTDISSGFFGAARERFGNVTGIEYQTLDISRDPCEQGFAAGTFDLIVAANVLHATPSLVETLKNVRKLLRPDGKLLLQELWTRAKSMNYIMVSNDLGTANFPQQRDWI